MALQNQRIYTSRHNYTAFYLDWSEEWISGGAENYSNISWRVGVHASGASPTWYSNSIKILSSNLGGNGLTTGTWSNITISNGASYQLGNGGFNYGHDSAGDAIIGGSIQGWLYGQGNTSTASGSWWLTHINRYAVITGLSGSITDEATNVYLSYSNPGGGSCTFDLFVRPLGSSGSFTQILNATGYSSGGNQAANVNWASLRSVLAGATQGQLLYRITNSVGATDHGWSNENIVTIINADPTFTTYTYKDNNSAMSTITGSDQVIVQNPGGLTNPTSDLLVTITAANKAVALKSATMVDYLTTLGAFSSTEAYSASTTVSEAVGGVNLSGAQTLQVRARDSRGNYKQVDTGITVLPYAMPVVSAHLSRSNNFDAAVRLTFDSITISSITVGGVDKNGVKSTATSTANRVEYRFLTNAGAYGSWVDRTASVAAGSGGVAVVTVTALDIVAAPTANNTYTAQVRVTDKLGNATVTTIYLGSGQPIFRIGTDLKIYNNEVQVMPTINDATLADSSILANTASTPTRKNVKDYVDLTSKIYANSNNTTPATTSTPGGYTPVALGTPVTLTVPVISGQKYLVQCSTTYMTSTAGETDFGPGIGTTPLVGGTYGAMTGVTGQGIPFTATVLYTAVTTGNVTFQILVGTQSAVTVRHDNPTIWVRKAN